MWEISRARQGGQGEVLVEEERACIRLENGVRLV